MENNLAFTFYFWGFISGTLTTIFLSGLFIAIDSNIDWREKQDERNRKINEEKSKAEIKYAKNN